MIVVGIASIPGRETNLQKTVESLSPFVDEIHICLNRYEKIPKFFLSNEKLWRHLSNNERGDATKFMGFIEVKERKDPFYYLTCDDDLIYGDSYVSMMIEGVDKYKCPVSLHGKTYDYPVRSWRVANTNYRCLDKVENDVEVDVVGTGCLAMHSDMMNISMFMFEKPNMADLWFSYEAKKAGHPLMVLAHPEGIVKYSLSDREPTIWKERVDEKFKTELVNKILKLPVK